MLLSYGNLPVTRLRATSSKGTRKKKFSMQIRATTTTVFTEYLFTTVSVTLSVLTATFFKVKDAVVNAGNFTGQCLLYVFFASAGASSPPLIHAFTNDANLLYFASTMFAVHLLAVGVMFSSPEMLVA